MSIYLATIVYMGQVRLNNITKNTYFATVCLLMAFVLGTWIRVRGVFHYPYLADEPRITQSGTRDMLDIGPDRHLGTGLLTKTFGVPLRNGQFLAPLWWWMQTSLVELTPGHEEILYKGTDTKLYRVVPLVWGVIGIAVFYRLAVDILPRPVPELMTLLLSINDLHVYMSSKSQYAETVLFVATLFIAYVLTRSKWSLKHVWIISSGIFLALAVFLAKGIAIVCVVPIVTIVNLFCKETNNPLIDLFRNIVGKRHILLAIFLPLILWWIGAEWFFQTNVVRVSDLGYFGHLWEPVLALTIGYGDQVKSFTTGPWYWALLIYSHGDVWPTHTFLAVPIIVGFSTACIRMVRGGQRFYIYAYIVVAIVVQISTQLIKGVDGARYHMIYLPASLLAAGLYFELLWLRTKSDKQGRLLCAISIFIIGTYLYLMLGWKHWLNEWTSPGRWGTIMLCVNIIASLLYFFGTNFRVRRLFVIVMVFLGVCLSIFRGPLHWGMFVYEEPSNINNHRNEIEAYYHPDNSLPESQFKSNANFADSLTLDGYDITYDVERVNITTNWIMNYQKYSNIQRIYAFVDTTLDWQLDKRLHKPYHLFIHILDMNSGKLVYGHDELMLDGNMRSVDQWTNYDVASLKHSLSISELPPGEYQIGIGIYEFYTGERLKITRGIFAGHNWLLLDTFVLQ